MLIDVTIHEDLQIVPIVVTLNGDNNGEQYTFYPDYGHRTPFNTVLVIWGCKTKWSILLPMHSIFGYFLVYAYFSDDILPLK